LLSPIAATEFRSVAGCIGYMAFSFRPELAVECSMLGRVVLSPSITDARKVNATLAWAKANRYVLKYLPGAKRLAGFADSAGPCPQDTQGGRLFALTDEEGFKSVLGFIGNRETSKESARRRTRVSFCLAPRP
jgi:hypothetical protein